jgi:hypothetical protein
MAASMPVPDDVNGLVVCGAVYEECSGAAHVAAADCHTSPVPTHCQFCDSGACRMTHVPALSIAFSPGLALLQDSLEPPQPRVARFKASFDKILRPPK